MGFFCRRSMLGARCLFFTFLLCIICFSLIGFNGRFVVEWSMATEFLDIRFPVILDSYRLLFSCVVITISFFVMIFSTRYMDSEEYLSRFIWLVMLFVLSMNLLIFVPRILGVILGWDGLGLISFLLVIYYQNKKSLGSGLVTAFINRVGDAFLLLGVAFLRCDGHWHIWRLGLFEGACLVFFLVVVLATTKRAQFPFSYWLPAAMSAPTPVSALVHSSTLVTAGIYLLIRVFPNFSVYRRAGCLWLLVVSIFTICMAGVRAYYEVDMKKVVALSTLRQLGIMIFSISLGFCSLAFFHLVSHALFKALLFIRVGCVIHNRSDWQDFRAIGGLWSRRPLSGGCVILAGIALRGLPFLGGFYSKDLVVERFLSGGVNWLVVIIVGVGLLTTLIYRIRLYYRGVCGYISQGSVQRVERLSLYDVIPIICIGVLSVLGGYFIQCFVFSFNYIFLLEARFKLFLLILLITGGIIVLVRATVKIFAFSFPNMIKVFMVSFFCTIWFSSHWVSMINRLGLQWSGMAYNKVDLGWNERVFGGLSVFQVIVDTSRRVLRLWRGPLGVCLGVAIVLLLLLIIVWSSFV